MTKFPSYDKIVHINRRGFFMLEWRVSSQSFIHPEVEARRRNLELTHSEVALLENGKVDTVRNWRKKHLTKAEYLACGGRTKDKWTSREETVARNTTLSNQQVSEIIDRSKASVRKWRYRNLSELQKEELLSIKTSRMPKKFQYEPIRTNVGKEITLSDINKILKNWDLPSREIAEIIGRPVNFIYNTKPKLKKLKEILNGIKDL